MSKRKTVADSNVKPEDGWTFMTDPEYIAEMAEEDNVMYVKIGGKTYSYDQESGLEEERTVKLTKKEREQYEKAFEVANKLAGKD